MKRQILCTALLSAAVAVGASAQTRTGTGTGAQSDKEQMTITGCLQQGSESATTGTSGSATGSAGKSAGSAFVLTNATAAARASSGSGTGTSGGASAPAASATSYKLSGGNQNDLKKYVNTQVEIRGKVEHSSASSGNPAGGTPSRSSDQSMPTLRVASVRQIASSCSGQ